MSEVTQIKKMVVSEVVIRLDVREAAILQHILGNIDGEWHTPVRQLASALYNALPFGLVSKEDAVGDWPIVRCSTVGRRGVS